jgi:D-alanine-D-alanine ligase
MSRIAVLRGGIGNAKIDSMESGQVCIDHYSKEHDVVDIVVDSDDKWFYNGSEVEPGKIMKGVDVAINALHGEAGENGKIQRILSELGVRYNGAGSLGSAISFSKFHSKKVYSENGIPSPHTIRISLEENDIQEVSSKLFTTMVLPMVIKPNRGHGWEHVYVAKNRDEIVSALEEVSTFTNDIIIEEYIEGREVHVAVLEGFRNKEFYTSLGVEPNMKDEDPQSYDLITKIPQEIREQIERYAIEAHRVLHMKNHSLSDFIVHPKRGIYILETTGLPLLGKDKPLSTGLEAAGGSVEEFLDHVIIKQK